MQSYKTFTEQFKNHSEFIESFKAKMDKKRSPLDRFIDNVTTWSGSYIFLTINIIWFVAWLIINLGWLPFIEPFDPFPFGFLTSAVSLEAIILSILVLISQNRASKVADLREEIHLQVNEIAEREITKVIEMLALLMEKNGIDMSKDSEVQKMMQPTDPQKIEETIGKQLEAAEAAEKQIEEEIENRKNSTPSS